MIVALAIFTSVAAFPIQEGTLPEIHAGLNKPVREVSPGLYHHEFEHVAFDGVKTAFAYRARRVEHLVELGDSEVGFVGLKCRQGSIVEVTVKNLSAPLSWAAGTAYQNATILVGNDDISCSDQNLDSGKVSILHRVLQAPALVSANKNKGQYVYSLIAEETHFSHAFEHLSLQFYRGKRDIDTVKKELSKAKPDEVINREQRNDSDAGASSRDAPESRSPTISESSVASSSMKASEPISLDFLTLLHDGDIKAATAAGGRHLLSTYSCGHADDCGFGTFLYSWDYGEACCCDDWGTCGWACATERKPVCSECTADKACATCSYCTLCTGWNSCDSCVYGSDRPYRASRVAGYTCEECADDNHCDDGSVCNKPTTGRWTCEVNEAISTCKSEMPEKTTNTVSSNSKYIVKLKTVTVKEHDTDAFSEGNKGTHEYFMRTQQKGYWTDNIALPCLTQMDANVALEVNAAIAEVNCGDSFRFGIWEDDTALGGFVGFYEAMGDKWFSTLDFITSSTIFYNTETSKVSFVIECEGCKQYCTDSNSMTAVSTPDADDVTWALSNELTGIGYSRDTYLPIGIWNFDSDTKQASEAIVLSGGGMTMNCEDCHLTVSDADLFIDVETSLASGIEKFAVWADVEVTFHIKALLESEGAYTKEWTKALIEIAQLPYPLHLDLTVAGVGFKAGLKAGVDLVTLLAASVSGSAEYTSDVKGDLKFGLVYDVNNGASFLNNAGVNNENPTWKNSINGAMTAKLAIRPCLQAGIWGNAGSVAQAHAYAEGCADVFALAKLSHTAAGFSTSPTDTGFSTALVKLDEALPDLFKSCEVTTTSKHDTRLLVDVGIGNPKLRAEWYADITWGSGSATDEEKAAQQALKTSSYGPWSLPGAELSLSVASGCMCVSACSSGETASGVDTPQLPETPSLPPAPSSTDVIMPTSGAFVQGALLLVGMQLFEWNADMELAFRKTMAGSANVWVNHVRVESVTQTVVARRRLLESTALDVKYVVYATNSETMDTIASRITADVISGDFLVKARMNGMSGVTSLVVSEAPNTLVLVESAALGLPQAACVSSLLALMASFFAVRF